MNGVLRQQFQFPAIWQAYTLKLFTCSVSCIAALWSGDTWGCLVRGNLGNVLLSRGQLKIQLIGELSWPQTTPARPSCRIYVRKLLALRQAKCA
eukprot:scaffold84174_cov18-Prasinocladus_malaysianus.AAC.2